MPRRDTYLTDDEDDSPRRGAASGGGTPGWVWVVVGGGALAALVVVGLGFFAFSRREAAVRHEAARADTMRVEAQMRPTVPAPDAVAGPKGTLPPLSLTRITNLYKNDRPAADRKYTGQQVRVRAEVRVTAVRPTGERWAGAAADLGDGVPQGAEANVVFHLGDEVVAAGTTVVIEGRCDGMVPDPRGGETLVFTNCRVVPVPE